MRAIKFRRVRASARSKSAEEAHAVGSFTDLIHKLYGCDGPDVTMRKLPDDELIEWSKVKKVVRDC